jgi:predicted nucleic acid-binding protein
MSFLLDTDICSAYLKNDRQVIAQVMLHFGGLHVSVVSVGELLTWALRANAPASRLQGVRDFLTAAAIVEITLPVAERFGELRAALLDQGKPTGELDLLIAACALVNQLTLVTHNTKDYANIPGLTVVDWMIP